MKEQLNLSIYYKTLHFHFMELLRSIKLALNENLGSESSFPLVYGEMELHHSTHNLIFKNMDFMTFSWDLLETVGEHQVQRDELRLFSE